MWQCKVQAASSPDCVALQCGSPQLGAAVLGWVSTPNSSAGHHMADNLQTLAFVSACASAGWGLESFSFSIHGAPRFVAFVFFGIQESYHNLGMVGVPPWRSEPQRHESLDPYELWGQDAMGASKAVNPEERLTSPNQRWFKNWFNCWQWLIWWLIVQ